MKIVTSLTSNPKQRFLLRLDNNTTAIMRLYYYASQQSWYFDIEYDNYINNGNKVVLTMNAIRHLRDKLPFGIAFISPFNADPFLLNDFVDGNVVMLLLNEDDVKQIEELVYSE